MSLTKVKILENVSLAPLTTYAIGGSARYFARPKTSGELLEALDWAEKNKQLVYILGGGSNLLISDKGYDGLIIKLNNQQINEKEAGTKTVLLEAGGGLGLGALLQFCNTAPKFVTGLEWSAGIPGCVGGAVFGNAGAFGQSMQDKVQSVYVYDLVERNFKTYKNTDCAFGYRQSLFKQGQKIIWSVSLKLELGDAVTGRQMILDHLKERKQKQPLEYPSAGSVFKNVPIQQLDKNLPDRTEILQLFKETIPAGWLIEKSGLKGYRIGNAQVSPKHCNFLINLGGAKAQDIFALIQLIQKTVSEKFNLKLVPEINFLGKFD
ncbi:MAG TPA: UDP-N-acetylmuramate dehydrogenase [Candidatus Paceibacterota bacterium]|nr:UDP-N-acetylmuramate dehydrogenase [Candidatus Paceibacterota bacterium]